MEGKEEEKETEEQEDEEQQQKKKEEEEEQEKENGVSQCICHAIHDKADDAQQQSVRVDVRRLSRRNTTRLRASFSRVGTV